MSVVYLGDILEVKMRIDLRGRNAGVAEHLPPRRSCRTQHVAREGVAQHMRVDVLSSRAASPRS